MMPTACIVAINCMGVVSDTVDINRNTMPVLGQFLVRPLPMNCLRMVTEPAQAPILLAHIRIIPILLAGGLVVKQQTTKVLIHAQTKQIQQGRIAIPYLSLYKQQVGIQSMRIARRTKLSIDGREPLKRSVSTSELLHMADDFRVFDPYQCLRLCEYGFRY